MMLLALSAFAARAADDPMLQAGEQIEVPNVSLKFLGVEIVRGSTVTLRLRATTTHRSAGYIERDGLRLFVAGVPRAPVKMTSNELTIGAVSVPKEAAVDFVVVFSLPERVDDLVFQVRVDNAVHRRRLAGK
jgi:hypothetical protein